MGPFHSQPLFSLRIVNQLYSKLEGYSLRHDFLFLKFLFLTLNPSEFKGRRLRVPQADGGTTSAHVKEGRPLSAHRCAATQVTANLLTGSSVPKQSVECGTSIDQRVSPISLPPHYQLTVRTGWDGRDIAARNGRRNPMFYVFFPLAPTACASRRASLRQYLPWSESYRKKTNKTNKMYNVMLI